MVDDKPVREEDNKLVLAKISRDEYVNLKSICKRENNKSVNKKLKELIQQDIARVFNTKSTQQIKGQAKKFFIPSENRFIDLFEVEE